MSQGDVVCCHNFAMKELLKLCFSYLYINLFPKRTFRFFCDIPKICLFDCSVVDVNIKSSLKLQLLKNDLSDAKYSSRIHLVLTDTWIDIEMEAHSLIVLIFYYIKKYKHSNQLCENKKKTYLLWFVFSVIMILLLFNDGLFTEWKDSSHSYHYEGLFIV